MTLFFDAILSLHVTAEATKRRAAVRRIEAIAEPSHAHRHIAVSAPGWNTGSAPRACAWRKIAISQLWSGVRGPPHHVIGVAITIAVRPKCRTL
jgi:hypothetical protein